MARRTDRIKPFSEEEIGKAVARSGYPFEIHLAEQFKQAGFDPLDHHRFHLPSGESVEVDVVAHSMSMLKEHHGIVNIRAMIEAKSWTLAHAFIGYKWSQPNQHEMRSMRIRFAGLPNCQVLGVKNEQQPLIQLLLGGPAPLASALDPLNDAPVCVQWSNVMEHKEGSQTYPMADRDDRLEASYRKLFEVTATMEEENALFLQRAPKDGLLRFDLYNPTIIINSDKLYTYDAVTQQLEKVPWLVLHEKQVANGRMHSRYVDVLSSDAVPVLINKYRQVAGSLKEGFDAHLHELVALAEKQREVRAIDDMERYIRQRDLS